MTSIESKQVYLAYQFQGRDKTILRERLECVDDTLKMLGYSTYIHFRDAQNWGAVKSSSNFDIIQSALQALKQTDLLLAISESEARSEGMLLEIGYAHALNKPIYLACPPESNLRFSAAIAQSVMTYQTFPELIQQIKTFPRA